MVKILVVVVTLVLGLFFGRYGRNQENSDNTEKGYPYHVDEPNDVYYGPQVDDPEAPVYFGPQN